MIDRVKAIHGQVTGVLPDGRPYAADDPDLLTYVHVAEVSSFLGAYVRHVDPAFSGADQDRYYGEVAEIARRLGAADVPTTRAQVAAYLERVRPQLRCDSRARAVASALLSHPAPSLAATPAMAIAFDAAKDLLPPWAARLHGFQLTPARQGVARAGIQGLAVAMRWALVNSAEARARRRAAELAVAWGSRGSGRAGALGQGSSQPSTLSSSVDAAGSPWNTSPPRASPRPGT